MSDLAEHLWNGACMCPDCRPQDVHGHPWGDPHTKPGVMEPRPGPPPEKKKDVE